jgi:hypothetical protein
LIGQGTIQLQVGKWFNRMMTSGSNHSLTCGI